MIFTRVAQALFDSGFFTFRKPSIFTAPPPLEGRCTYMKLRDLFELVRIQLHRQEGQTMAEYGILIAVIAIIAAVGAAAFGTHLSTFFTNLSGQL